MKEPRAPSITKNGFNPPTWERTSGVNLQFENRKDVKSESKILQVNGDKLPKRHKKKFSINGLETETVHDSSNYSFRDESEKEIPQGTFQNAANLFRLFVKNGEYVYARPNDIIMIESCDHLVKVYVAIGDKIKRTVRHSTLKNMLLQLPQDQFMRIGRFCAINLHRISGGNCNEQTFEFDFMVSIKLKHSISQTAFGNIGK